MRLLAFLVFAAMMIVLATIVSREHQAIYAMPLVRTSAQPVVIPWVLNTRCSVNSRNLPVRSQEIRT